MCEFDSFSSLTLFVVRVDAHLLCEQFTSFVIDSCLSVARTDEVYCCFVLKSFWEQTKGLLSPFDTTSTNDILNSYGWKMRQKRVHIIYSVTETLLFHYFVSLESTVKWTIAFACVHICLFHGFLLRVRKCILSSITLRVCECECLLPVLPVLPVWEEGHSSQWRKRPPNGCQFTATSDHSQCDIVNGTCSLSIPSPSPVPRHSCENVNEKATR